MSATNSKCIEGDAFGWERERGERGNKYKKYESSCGNYVHIWCRLKKHSTHTHTDNDDSINAHKTLTLRLTNKLWTANELDSSILKCTQISIAMRRDAIYYAHMNVRDIWIAHLIHFRDMVWFLKFAFAFKFSVNGISFRRFWSDFLLIFYSNENSGEHGKHKVMWHIFSICLANILVFHLYLRIHIGIPHPITLHLLACAYDVCECFSLLLAHLLLLLLNIVRFCLHQFYLLCILSIPTHSIWMSVNQIESTNC